MHSDNLPWYRRSLWVLMGLAFAVRLTYMLYTKRVWEDALITVQHSVDFARGMGLTHPQPPGEGPLHGFTSPLSVLIPLAGDLMHVGFGITFLKIVSLFAGMGAVWLAARIARGIGLPPVLALSAAAFAAFEHHQILWGMAGMETQVVTTVYLFVLFTLLFGNQWQKGVALGLAMLGRPDAIFLVAIAFVVEAYHAYREHATRRLLPVATGLVALYGPWLLFTTLYYGSPVPNTIRAKVNYGNFTASLLHMSPGPLLGYLKSRFFLVFHSMGPSYSGNGGFVPLWDHYYIGKLMVFFMIIGLGFALKCKDGRALIVFAFAICYGLYLTLGVIVIFGWYTVPIAAAAVLCALYGIWSVLSLLPDSLRIPSALAVAAVYILTIVTVLPRTFESDKYVQKDVETDVRMKMGQYIHDHSLPGDTAGSESLGYVGYYSERVVYDYPGLCNRDVVKFFHDNPTVHGIMPMLQHFEPTYMVLRPAEIAFMKQGPWQDTWIGKDYDLAKTFKVDSDELNKHVIHPEVNSDQTFYLFRRKDAASRANM